MNRKQWRRMSINDNSDNHRSLTRSSYSSNECHEFCHLDNENVIRARSWVNIDQLTNLIYGQTTLIQTSFSIFTPPEFFVTFDCVYKDLIIEVTTTVASSSIHQDGFGFNIWRKVEGAWAMGQNSWRITRENRWDLSAANMTQNILPRRFSSTTRALKIKLDLTQRHDKVIVQSIKQQFININ